MWLRFADVARILADLRPRGLSFDLVFLQQCGRATVSTLGTLAPYTDVLIASQGPIGSPNGYYGEMVRALEREPSLSAEALARAIVHAEPEDGFVDLVAFRASAVAELERRVGARLSTTVPVSGVTPTYSVGAQRFIDLVAWVAPPSVPHTPELTTLLTFIRDTLVLVRRTSPLHGAHARSWSGVSAVAPPTVPGPR
jgi:hypothetical protein